MKRLLVTGDDFGLATPVNEAIEKAHREGILRTASLMVTGRAAADAVARAQKMPDLGVGLHLVLVEGQPALSPTQVPDLVDANDQFLNDFVRAGFRFFFRPGIRRQLRDEIRAQFEAFRATGLTLDHVNTHNHMHLHPTILGLILEIGRDFGLRALRLPREAATAATRRSRLGDAFLSPWLAQVERRARRASLRTNDQVLGLRESGFMDETTVLKLLEHLPEGVTEMYFHPASGHCPEIERFSPDARYNQELAALLSPRVRTRLAQLDVEVFRFRDL